MEDVPINIGLEMGGVMTEPIIKNVTMMVGTAVDQMLILHSAQNVNALVNHQHLQH